MLLPQPRREAQDEVDAFGLVDPVLQCSGEFLVGQGGAGEGAGGPEVALGDGTITRQRAVAEEGDELEVLGHEDRGGHAVALVDHDLVGEVFVFVAVDDAEVDALGVGLGDACEEGDLLDAVAAPCAAGDEDLHVAREAAEECGLCGVEVGAVVDALEGLLLGGFAGGDVAREGVAALVVGLEEFGVEHG